MRKQISFASYEDISRRMKLHLDVLKFACYLYFYIHLSCNDKWWNLGNVFFNYGLHRISLILRYGLYRIPLIFHYLLFRISIFFTMSYIEYIWFDRSIPYTNKHRVSLLQMNLLMQWVNRSPSLLTPLSSFVISYIFSSFASLISQEFVVFSNNEQWKISYMKCKINSCSVHTSDPTSVVSSDL